MTVSSNTDEIYATLKDEFDEQFYAKHNPELVSQGADLLEHYLHTGWKEKQDPTPYFSTKYYYEHNSDVRKYSLNPFYHYIKWGRPNNRYPKESEEVDESIIKVIYEELQDEFDSDFYAEQNPELVKDDVDLLEHYIRRGWKEGRDPTRSFSTNYYLENNKDLREYSYNPFYHYIKWGKPEKRHPSAKCDKNHQNNVLKDEFIALKDEFDEKFYSREYPELVKDNINLLDHYIRYGWKEGRDPTSGFSTEYYLKTNKDVRDKLLNPFYHYVKWGKLENRCPKELTYKANESRLLLYCARTHFTEEIKEKIKHIIKQDIDWNYIRRIAQKNKVILLVYNGLITACPELVNNKNLNQLKDLVDKNISYNEEVFALLLELLDLFKNHGIDVVPFKGSAFSLSIYKSFSIRHVGDIDLLVRRENFLKAKDVLIKNGYHHIYFGHAEVSTVQAQLARDDGRTGVDLHYALTPQYQHTNMDEAYSGSKFELEDAIKQRKDRTNWYFYLDTDPVWQRIEQLSIENRSISVLSPEDMLLITSIHAAKDSWSTWHRICDIAELIRVYPELDWGSTLVSVRKLNFERKFLFGIRLAHDLLDVNIPNEITETNRIESSSLLTFLTVKKQIQLCEDKFSDNQEPELLTSLLTMDNNRDRVRYIAYITRRLHIPNNPTDSFSNYVRFLCNLFYTITKIISFKFKKEDLKGELSN